jgi:hypothetical protein
VRVIRDVPVAYGLEEHMAVPEHASFDARGRGSSVLVPLPLSRGVGPPVVTVVTDDFRPFTVRGSDDGSDGEVGVVAMPPSAAMTFETRR